MELLGQMTQRGKELRQQALRGEGSLLYVRAAAGSGTTGLTATVLAGEQQTLPMGDLLKTENSVILPVTLTAALAAAEYTLWEVGVYVQDGAGETLYCVYRADKGLEISPDSTMTLRVELEEVSAEQPDIAVSPGGLVTRDDLAALMGAPGGIATLDEDTAVPMAQLPFTFGTEDLTPGVTALESGTLHFVYE